MDNQECLFQRHRYHWAKDT